ncbi:MAG: biotin/lipoyl-containing protein [Armatimonadota bacterium]
MDLERIESLIKVIKNARVTELAVKMEDSSILIRKSVGSNGSSASRPGAVKRARPSSASAEQAMEDAPAGTVISAPMVGIFHTVEGISNKGAAVKTGQVIGAIESMKLLNDVRSEVDGVVDEAYVDDGMPVEYGQALFRLVKSAENP